MCATNKHMPVSQCDPWPCFPLLSSSCVRISAHRDMLIWRQSAQPMQLSWGSLTSPVEISSRWRCKSRDHAPLWFSAVDKTWSPAVNLSAQSEALPPVYPASPSEINPVHVHQSCRFWSRKRTLAHTFWKSSNIHEKYDIHNTLHVLKFWIVYRATEESLLNILVTVNGFPVAFFAVAKNLMVFACLPYLDTELLMDKALSASSLKVLSCFVSNTQWSALSTHSQSFWNTKNTLLSMTAGVTELLL